MSEPISIVLSACLGLATANGYFRNDSAVSTEAKFASAKAADVLKSSENSFALFGAKAEALSSLRDLADECVNDDWDGNGSLGINALALWKAEEFIRALPFGVQMPEFSAEPDGSISLDWIKSRFQIFSVSVGSNNRLAYAWLDGTDKGHAVAQFDGVTVPSRILSEIQPLAKNGKTTFRIA